MLVLQQTSSESWTKATTVSDTHVGLQQHQQTRPFKFQASLVEHLGQHFQSYDVSEYLQKHPWQSNANSQGSEFGSYKLTYLLKQGTKRMSLHANDTGYNWSTKKFFCISFRGKPLCAVVEPPTPTNIALSISHKWIISLNCHNSFFHGFKRQKVLSLVSASNYLILMAYLELGHLDHLLT